MDAIFIIRHTEPEASWIEASDPGLSAKGHRQAAQTAQAMAARGSTLPLFSSPMRRARETAQPLEGAWGGAAHILPAFTEIPSPDLPCGKTAERGPWIQRFMAGRWGEALAGQGGGELARWREALLQSFAGLAGQGGGVVFSHFIAINALLAQSGGDDAVLQARPAHGSIWQFRLSARPQLAAPGAQQVSAVR